MEVVLINVEKKSDVTLLVSFAKKMGMSAKSLSKVEVEDWQLAQRIESGMKSKNVQCNDIVKVLVK